MSNSFSADFTLKVFCFTNAVMNISIKQLRKYSFCTTFDLHIHCEHGSIGIYIMNYFLENAVSENYQLPGIEENHAILEKILRKNFFPTYRINFFRPCNRIPNYFFSWP